MGDLCVSPIIDASITLHSVTGGDINIDDIPWKPTARCTGISVCKATTSTSATKNDNDNNVNDVTTVNQKDHCDSINIVPNSGGDYGAVEKRGRCVRDQGIQLSLVASYMLLVWY
mmetsp:Transcript_16403/g.20759  ORF Transcript_16403/g.20759 Transcript_16403/m.20759 type:complete len:115 (+) Transcript_16403:392-736(+)|eukprot:CAMPEP_0203732296 /NCGR_PEP_ID=MMETSP0092-20131115/24749_1 /ASSEMBLY_ACC=CAM_ASM_001090 /TAXON_ID=426623 /ORGANISM="Chaetoceros affinis, Strain CCMP159" /LENGTH=114 /DNA_ID=CAMNT_0050615797 /DNA_START=77 /DNA_END=421 /DNA_ORIENTATION=-